MKSASPTAAALQLESVAAGSLEALSCEIAPGKTLRFISTAQHTREVLWNLLTGLAAPRQGHVMLMGRDVFALPEPERLALFQRIGTVAHDGGLISNLRVWENILLPVWYHRGSDGDDVEQRVLAMFGDLGLNGSAVETLVRRLPEQLNIVERRWAAVVRAMLMEPDVMVVDSPFSGMEREAATRLLGTLNQFQRAHPQRVTVFLLPDEPFSQRVTADVTIALETEQ